MLSSKNSLTSKGKDQKEDPNVSQLPAVENNELEVPNKPEGE